MRTMTISEHTFTMGPFLKPFSPLDRELMAKLVRSAKRRGFAVNASESDEALTFTAVRTQKVQEVRCICGAVLVRNGVVVEEHWIGETCDACVRVRAVAS